MLPLIPPRVSRGWALLLALLSLSCLPSLRARSAPQPLPETRALLDQGKSAEQQSRKDEAARFYEQALAEARASKDRPGEAAALLGLGGLILTAQPAKAQGYYQQALPIYEEISDAAGRAACLYYLGSTEKLQGHAQPALGHYEAAYQLFTEHGEKNGQALALLGVADVYRDTGFFDKAIPLYDRLLPVYREAGDKKRQVYVLMSLGRCQLEKRDIPGGRQVLEEALPLARELGDKANESRILHNLGGIYSLQGEVHKAVEALKEVLPLLEESGSKADVAFCLNNIGVMSFRGGDYLTGLEYSRRSLAIQQELGNKEGAATALKLLATYYVNLGQKEEALALCQEALRTILETDNVRQRAEIMGNLGRIYGLLGRRAEERSHLEQALALNRQVGDRYTEAFNLHYLSSNLWQAGDRQGAGAAAEQSRKQFHDLKDAHGEGASLMRLGDFAADGQQVARALEHYGEALALYQALGYPSGESDVLYRIGQLEELQGRLPEAEQCYAQAVASKERLRASLGGLTESKFSYLEGQVPLYRSYIRLLLRTGQNAKAYEWVQKTKARVLLDLMTTGKAPVPQPMSEAGKQQEQELKRRDRELSQKWLAALKEQDELAARSTTDRTRHKQAEQQRQAIRRQQAQLEQDWQAFSEARYLESPHLAPTRSASAARLEEVAALLPPDTALLEYLVLDTGQEAGKLGSARQPAKQDVVALFVVSQQGGKARLNVYRIPTFSGSLGRLTASLREACAGRPGTAAERPYKDLSRRLYRLLVAPAEAALSGKQRLLLCPDGPLWDVPFQALVATAERRAWSVERPEPRTPNAQRTTHNAPRSTLSAPRPARSPLHAPRSTAPFLWERYSIAYAYSGTGAKAALDARKRPDRPKAQQPLLVLADPTGGPAERASTGGTQVATRGAGQDPVSTFYSRAGGLGALPATRGEARAITASFPGATLRTDTAAQESLVKETAAGYRYLHFAAHAVFNDAAPMMSGVVLARPPKGSPEDGILTVREVFDLKLAADLVVLSACDTARGAKRSGEGVVGLTWAMFIAGVPTQVVSQWSVDDAATAELMGGFYRRLKGGAQKEGALRSAALGLLRDGKHSHPFYWAPFVLMGDWR